MVVKTRDFKGEEASRVGLILPEGRPLENRKVLGRLSAGPIEKAVVEEADNAEVDEKESELDLGRHRDSSTRGVDERGETDDDEAAPAAPFKEVVGVPGECPEPKGAAIPRLVTKHIGPAFALVHKKHLLCIRSALEAPCHEPDPEAEPLYRGNDGVRVHRGKDDRGREDAYVGTHLLECVVLDLDPPVREGHTLLLPAMPSVLIARQVSIEAVSPPGLLPEEDEGSETHAETMQAQGRAYQSFPEPVAGTKAVGVERDND